MLEVMAQRRFCNPSVELPAATEIRDDLEQCFVKVGARILSTPEAGDHDSLTVNIRAPGMVTDASADSDGLRFTVHGACERSDLARALHWLARRLEYADTLDMPISHLFAGRC
jgi:hypothetical protein